MSQGLLHVIMLQISQSTAQLIQLGANIILAIFTVVLAWATWKYTQQSADQTEEMRKSREVTESQTEEMRKSREVTEKQVEQMEMNREAEFKPVIVASASHNRVGTFHFLAIENIGEGTAQNLQVEWFIEDLEDTEREWTKPVFHPDERRIFNFPLDYECRNIGASVEMIEDALGDSEGILTVNISCEDALGNEYNYRHEIDIIDQLESRLESDEFWSDSHEHTNFGRHQQMPE